MIELEKHKLYERMDTDKVLSNIFSLYFKNFWILVLSSFVAALLIQFAFFQLGFYNLTQLTDPEELLSTIMSMRKELLIGTLIYFLVYGVLISFLINYLLIRDSNSNMPVKTIFTESLKNHTIHIIFFYMLSIIMLVVGASIGLMLFVIGIVFVSLYLASVLIPCFTIIIAENKNAFEAIHRSFSLVHKDFWSTVVSVITFVLIVIVISIILSALMAIPYVVMFFDKIIESGNLLGSLNLANYDIGIWTVVLNSIVAALTYPIYAIFSLILYFKLRYKEENPVL